MASRRQWIIVLLVGMSAWGCSKGDAPPVANSGGAGGSTAPAAGSSTSSSSPQKAPDVETPATMVTRFLEALRHGDRETVASLLTTAAREETVRLGYEINPPGDPTSKYQVGRVEIVSGEQEEAYVSSTWTHELEDGEVYSFEAVWIAKREPAGWRISGLAVNDPQSEQPLVFNFENLEEVFQTKDQVEQTASPDVETPRQALNQDPGIAPTESPLE